MNISGQHQQWCIHYQRDPAKMFGKGDERCAAGVSYDEVARVVDLGRSGCFLRLPCIRSHHNESDRQGQPLFECSLLRWPTTAESADFDRQAQEDIARLLALAPLLDEVRRDHEGEDWAGELTCPICETPLRLSHAAVNGHVHGQCQTEGCVSFME